MYDNDQYFHQKGSKAIFSGTALFYCIAAWEACGSNRGPIITSRSREGGSVSSGT